MSFEALKDPVELQINAGDKGPAEAQEKLYLLLQSHFRKVLQVALRSLHVEYQRVCKAQPGVQWPVVSNLKEQLHATPMKGVWLEDTHGHRFVLSFRADIDKEQHFHVFFHHWKVESVASERF